MAPRRRRALGAGFLLSQLGSHSAGRFAAAITDLSVTPAHVGLLRAIDAAPGRSQQAVAEQFGMTPSRMVVLVDELEMRGLVERRRSDLDRRVHSLHVTDAGKDTLDQALRRGTEAERALLVPLTSAERDELRRLLRRLAESHGLDSGIHPGYARLGR